jgi:cytochrome c oxidase cbb3-type subunit 3
MSKQTEQDRLLDHNYDGIQEYDNPLPRWWLALFWVTIVFAAVYSLYYHFGPGLLSREAYDKDMIAYYEMQANQALAQGEIDEQTLAGAMGNDAMMAGARQLFIAKCAQCHGTLGEGGIGPNLTDQYWLHGNRLVDIYRTVSEGVPTKGMLSWKKQLRPAELLSLAAYVGTLRGTSPPNSKAPQGELQPYDPDSAAATPDEDAAEG